MSRPSPSQRATTPVDAIIAERIVTRRRELGLSQQGLAQRLGVTFQQIQKYEKGTNRVAASRLYEIARVLETPLTDFFEPVRGAAKPARKKPRRKAPSR